MGGTPGSPGVRTTTGGGVTYLDHSGPSSVSQDLRAWSLSLLDVTGASETPTDPLADAAPARLHRLCVGLALALSLQGVSIDLRSRQGGDAVAAASDDRARGHAAVGLGVGEGPAHDAFALGRPVLIGDLGDPDAERWWAYGPTARAAGLCATFAFPLQVGASRFGVLSVFEGTPRRLSTDELARILAVAERATAVLLDSVDDDAGALIDPDLESALAFRNEVSQAQGMAMAALGTTLTVALARMQAHAFATGLDLNHVAIDIVEGRLRLDDDHQGSS